MENDKIIVEVVKTEEESTGTAKSDFKKKVDSFFKNAKEVAGSAWNWCKENKEDLAFLVPIGLTILAGIKKSSNGTVTDRERERINTTYYDPSTGLHWQLRRPLTNIERIELSERRRSGEFVEDILQDMRVLRR